MKILLAGLFFSVMALATEIKVGDIVYGFNGSDLVGTVNSVGDGEAEVTWTMMDGEPYGLDQAYTWKIENLSRISKCHTDICSGDIVSGVNNAGITLEGKAFRVFENGLVEILWNKVDGKETPFSTYYYWKSTSLTRIENP